MNLSTQAGAYPVPFKMQAEIAGTQIINKKIRRHDSSRIFIFSRMMSEHHHKQLIIFSFSL
ncbi:hypothetical protein AYY17_13575 [Morganella psychrotolerans]|uniref:Uncharacterized protein n=1 Tax=Morganella psychrotolerans TaxID=368603 RepID=A0A1B8GYZ4_9GAMM|nr:hypothetical protein AYY17_13575 [Morganella psychrotolerans]